MFFQINITPKEKKVAEPINKKQVNNTYSLLLAPFQPPTRIKLDALINTSVECELTIQNSNNRCLTASITKIPPQERHVSLSATEWSIQPESSVLLKILWEPNEAGSWRDILQLSDSRRIKYDIPLALTCNDPNKAANGKGGAKLKQRNPLGPKINSTSNRKIISSTTQKNTKSNINNKPIPPQIQVQPGIKRTRANEPDKENVSNNVGFNWMLEQARIKKQKKESPPAPLDFSKFLDSSTFKFTPMKSKFTCFESNKIHETFTPKQESDKNAEPLLSKQEYITVENKVQMTLRKETYITVPKYLHVQPSPEVSQIDTVNEEFDDSLSPRLPEVETEKPKSDISTLFNDIKFTPLKNPNADNVDNIQFSPNYCSTGHKSDRSKSYSDDSVNRSLSKNVTFDINLTNTSPGNNTYELPVSPTSSKDSFHLKPTCLAKTFEKNNIDMEFSTPFSARTIDHSRQSTQFSKSQIDFGSAKDCLEADLWVKNTPRNTSLSPISKNVMHSTLDSIKEEDIFGFNEENQQTYSAQNHKKEFKKPKPICIEISPPVKYTGKPPIRKISPTKSGRITKDKSIVGTVTPKKKAQINKSIKSNGSIQIPGVRITKLSLAGLSTDKVKTKPVRKQPKEVSVKLHDPNDFLTLFCNPDPFAATMTHDPFLANTLYYDDKAIFVQELEFKKWLNALLSPLENLSDVESATIDIGKVWQSCRAKEDVTLAETKESLSARYHTNTRLNTLRKAACATFRKPEVITALSQTTVSIEKEILIIRPDKDLHRDIGLQKTILELFICYNPLWLRIGLETIYGETIPLLSNNDVIGLSRFLLNRFFSDPFLVKAHSSHAHPTIRLKTFQPLMNKFMLKKFLFLVYFLDYAKRNKLIGHDPCLFRKKALLKDSRSILLTFSRELLSGIGDITKILKNYNYVVSHKQTYLDEYDYAVVNLCTDLRDGVRLCRVMELITGKRCLTCRCRVPAISRLQKVHNVNVALTTLNEAGYIITGDIDAKSIADGHKEKTLSLLWQIIHKFQAPRYKKAAETLQRWWRSKLWYINVRNMLRNRRDNAASTIQRAWRCYVARRQLHVLKEEYARKMQLKMEAARKIQLRWRLRSEGKKQQKQYLHIKNSIMKIQRWWRRIQSTKPYIENYRRNKKLIISVQRRWRATQLMKTEKNSFLELKKRAIQIQTLWRARRLGRQVRQNYQQQKSAIIYVQNKWRGKLLMRRQRSVYLRSLAKIKLIQNWWRYCLIMKRDRNYFTALKHSVRIIEKVWIAKHTVTEERKTFLQQKNSANIIQRSWKNYRATKNDVALYKRKKNACLKLQTWWRSVAATRKYAKQRLAIIKLQNWRRSVVLTRNERSSFLRLKHSAIILQKNWKMRQARKNYKRKKASVLKIEMWYQNLVLSRRVRNQYLKLKASVKTIENRWQALKIGKRARIEFTESRKAIVAVQRRWRAHLFMKLMRQKYLKTREAIVKLQSWWRMVQEMQRYKELLRKVNAATVLQRRWRALQVGKQARQTYAMYKTSVTLIQRKWRATRLAKIERREFLQKRNSAIVMQKNWRSLVLMREFKRKKNAVKTIEMWRRNMLLGRQVRAEFLQLKTGVICLQRLWRTKQQMKKFQKQRESVIVIQKYWKSYVATKEYQRKKHSAIVLQRWRRHVLAGRRARNEFIGFKQSVIKVQRLWRTIRQMREFARQRWAVIIIQKNWKSYVALKDYQKKREAAQRIQRWRRNLLLGRQTRNQFTELRDSVIKVQSHWKMRQQRKKYLAIREAAIVIQKHWRRVAATREFEKKKIAVMFIENWRKHTLFGRQVRLEFLKWKMTITRMQQLYRVKKQVREYQRMRDAAIRIQRYWRSIREMRVCRSLYERQKSAAIVLQRRYRARRIAVLVREEYRHIILTIIRIQRWWRSILFKRQLEMWKEKRKWAVLTIENWWINSSEERRAREAARAEMRRKRRAAIRIQATWRGFRVRLAACNKLRLLRERAAKAAQEAVPSATLAFRLQENIEIFKYATNIGQLSVCLSSLDVITRLSPNACVSVCQLNLVSKLYDILTRANRSLPWLDVCLKDISILLTLAKFKLTTAYVLREEHIEVLARLLTISADKKEDLFLHTATLLWILTENEEYAEAVKNCCRTKYLLTSLYTTINKKLNRAALTSSLKYKGDAFPSPKPDWGLKHKRPRIFTSVSQAITSIASRLKILNISQVPEMQRSFNFSM